MGGSHGEPTPGTSAREGASTAAVADAHDATDARGATFRWRCTARGDAEVEVASGEEWRWVLAGGATTAGWGATDGECGNAVG